MSKETFPVLDQDNPESPESLETTLAFADGFYSGLQIIVKDFERSHNMILPCVRLSNERRDKALGDLWTRGYAWLLTLEKLDHSKHYQAVATACRTWLEIAVDIALIHKSDSSGLATKMKCFMDSEKLKMAESVVGYYERNRVPVPEQYSPQVEFIANNKNGIEGVRQILWQQKKHPRRWTNRSLDQDIREVDGLMGDEIKDHFGFSLEEFYCTEYRRINWHIHSGLASTWQLPIESFDIWMGFGLKYTVDLAFFATKVVLLDLGLVSVLPELKRQWADLQDWRDRVFLEKTGVI